jgi:hypothetical protein
MPNLTLVAADGQSQLRYLLQQGSIRGVRGATPSHAHQRGWLVNLRNLRCSVVQYQLDEEADRMTAPARLGRLGLGIVSTRAVCGRHTDGWGACFYLSLQAQKNKLPPKESTPGK